MNAFIMQKMIMKLSLLDFQENTYLSSDGNNNPLFNDEEE